MLLNIISRDLEQAHQNLSEGLIKEEPPARPQRLVILSSRHGYSPSHEEILSTYVRNFTRRGGIAVDVECIPQRSRRSSVPAATCWGSGMPATALAMRRSWPMSRYLPGQLVFLPGMLPWPITRSAGM